MWLYEITAARVLALTKKKGAKAGEDVAGEVDEDSEPPQHTPSSDSAGEDYEFLDKSVDSVGKAKSSGQQSSGARKRKGKKR